MWVCKCGKKSSVANLCVAPEGSAEYHKHEGMFDFVFSIMQVKSNTTQMLRSWENNYLMHYHCFKKFFSFPHLIGEINTGYKCRLGGPVRARTLVGW